MKTAFIVEGQTEQVFLLRFIEKLVTLAQLNISLQKLHGNKIIDLSSRGVSVENATHHIIIINVENDDKVNSYINDNVASMKAKGYSAVYGLRDIYTGSASKPEVNSEKIDRWASGLATTYGIKISVAVAVREIEAWFLSVPAFFLAYDPSLNPEAVNKALGMDLAAVDVEALNHPAQLIDDVLRSVGKHYRKRLDDAHKIAHTLDYESLYLEKAQHLVSLQRVVDQLTSALPSC